MNQSLVWNKKFSKNKKGVDYFVGDLHGQRDALLSALDGMNFDYDVDRLFCAGDLINKGPDSKGCIDLLLERWFNSVFGNHELIFVQSYSLEYIRSQMIEMGGGWVESLSDREYSDYADLISCVTSLSMTVEHKKGRVGVIHASSPKNWRSMSSPPKCPKKSLELINQFVWSFDQGEDAALGDAEPIKGIQWVVSGHLSTNRPIVGGNHLWIDTFQKAREFTIVSADTLFSHS